MLAMEIKGGQRSDREEILEKLILLPRDGCKESASYHQLTASPAIRSRFRRYSEEAAKVVALRLPPLHLLWSIVGKVDAAVIPVYLLALPSRALEEGEGRHLAENKPNDKRKNSSRSLG